MVNGDQDFIFPVQTCSSPCSPGHAGRRQAARDPPAATRSSDKRGQVFHEVVDWLDKYLGRVQ